MGVCLCLNRWIRLHSQPVMLSMLFQLTRWPLLSGFWDLPSCPNTKSPTAAAQTFPAPLSPASKEKKKSKHKACSSTNEADSFKNVRKDWLELPCLPSVPKEHDSFKSPFSPSMIRFYSYQNNNARPAPEKVQLFLCWMTQSTFVGLEQHGKSWCSYSLPNLLTSAKRFMQHQPTATKTH